MMTMLDGESINSHNVGSKHSLNNGRARIWLINNAYPCVADRHVHNALPESIVNGPAQEGRRRKFQLVKSRVTCL